MIKNYFYLEFQIKIMSGTIRLTREIEDIRKNPPSNCSAQPVDDNIYHWKAQLFGPEGTPYAGGISFFLQIILSNLLRLILKRRFIILTLIVQGLFV